MVRGYAAFWTSEDVDFAKLRRKSHVAWREEMAGYQRLGGEAARFFAQEVKRHQRAEKAVTILLAERDGDGWNYPAELAAVIAHEAGCVEYRIACNATS